MSWPSFWLKPDWRSWLLSPLAWLVCVLARRRLKGFRAAKPTSPGLVIVVGNIVVGGSGKTPFIQYLVNLLVRQGLKVGIISRGYGGKSAYWPQVVTALSDPAQVGDEPVLLAKALNCPIVVSPKRAEALDRLNAQFEVDVVISDDGLQHYALARDIEIVLLDASRGQHGLGNGLCMPAGPLREPDERLQDVDAIVFNGLTPSDFAVNNEVLVGNMQLRPQALYALHDPQQTLDLTAFSGQQVYAVAGIGNPQRFYDTLAELGVEVKPLAFADHHAFKQSDFNDLDAEKPLLMTTKDAVKCQAFARPNWWVLAVQPQCSAEFEQALLMRILQHPKLQGTSTP